MNPALGAVSILLVTVATLVIGSWGMRVNRTTSDFLFITTSRKPGSWWVNPLWSWRQTWLDSR